MRARQSEFGAKGAPLGHQTAMISSITTRSSISAK
jgi:hypothetical protein